MKYHQMKALLVRRKGGKIHLGGKLHDGAINGESSVVRNCKKWPGL